MVMEGLNGGNSAGEEMPRPRMWWEGQLEVSLRLLEEINRRREDYHNPEYWKRVRREQREREARERQEEEQEVAVDHVEEAAEDELVLEMKQALKAIIEAVEAQDVADEEVVDEQLFEAMRREEEEELEVAVNQRAEEEAVGAENELVLEVQEAEVEDIGEEQAIVEVGEEAGDRRIDVLNEVAGDDDGHGGDGFENALEEEEILERVGVTNKVAGGDAGTEDEEEVEGGAVIFEQQELNRLVEGQGGAVHQGSFEGGREVTGQDREEANTPSTRQVTEDKVESQAEDNNHVEPSTPPKKNKRHSVIIPAHVTVLPGIPLKYQCQLCQKAFKDKRRIQCHRFCGQPNTPKPFQCSICDKGFLSKANYQCHLLRHQKLRPYKCIFCHQGCFQQDDLNRHLRSHIREKPYMCQECPGCFSDNQGLQVHVEAAHRAKGTKDFVCAQCPKRFNTKKYLNSHVSSAHGNRKFECVECGKVFGRKFNLNIHVRAVHLKQRPHSCKSCTSSFFNKNDLRRHSLTHTDKPFKCRICGKGFSRKGNLEVHIRNVHGVAKEKVADHFAIEAVCDQQWQE